MILIRSQLLFKNILSRFPPFLFTTIPANSLIPSPQVQEANQSHINDYRSMKNQNEYFTIYHKYEKLFQKQGLLNYQSDSIKSSLTPEEISIISNQKKWFEGKIDLNHLSIKQTDCFINITYMLLNKAKEHQQIVNIVEQFDKKLDQILNKYTVAEQNLRQGSLILKYLKTRKNNELFERLQQKIIDFLNSNRNKGIKMAERIFQQLSVYGGFNDIILEMLCQYPVKQVLKLDIQVENLPIAYFNNNVQELCQHIEYIVQLEGQPIASSRIVKIITMLNHFQDNKNALNTLIIIIFSLIKYRGDKSSKHTISIVNEILSKQRSSLLLFYVLTYHEVNLSKMFDIERYMPFSQQSLLNKAILSIIIHKNKNINRNYAKLIKTEIEACFTSLASFLSLYNAFRIINLPKFVQFFIEIYHRFFRDLPNPFQVYRKQAMTAEKSLYMQFFFQAYPYKDKQIFLKRYQEQINKTLVEEIVLLHLQQNKTKFIVDKYYNYLLLTHFKEAIRQENVKLLKLGLQFLEVYRKAGVQRTQNQFTQLKIWKLIGNYITNLSIIKKLGLEQALYSMILGYIKVDDVKNYKHDYHYKRMIWDLAKQINNIDPQHEIYHLIIRQALAYDSINKFNLEILGNIKINESKLTKGQLLKFACLKGQKIILNIIREDDIEALLVNGSFPQYQEIIDKNIDHIMKLLSISKQSVIFSCLSSYNRQRSPNNDKILNFLLESATKLSHKDLDKIDFITVFKKCLKLGYFNIPNYLIFWNQIIEHLCFRLHRLTINSHIQLMEFLHTQPLQVVNRQLVMKYLRFIRKFCNQQIVVYTNTITTLYYMLTLSNLPFSRERMQKLWERMKHTGFIHLHFHELSLILIQQQYLSVDFMQTIIHKYENYVNELQRRSIMYPNYKFIYDLHYRYLKAKYPPDLMKRLVLDEKRLQQYIFTQSHPRIFLSTVNSVCTLLNCSWQYVTTYNVKNKIIKIKQTMLIFLSPYKNGCLKEQQFIIKMLKLLENNENISFVIIKYYDPSTYEADLINSIHKQSSLLTRQQRDLLIASIKQQKTEKLDISKVQVESREEEVEKDDIEVGDQSDQIVIQEDDEHQSDEL